MRSVHLSPQCVWHAGDIWRGVTDTYSVGDFTPNRQVGTNPDTHCERIMVQKKITGGSDAGFWVNGRKTTSEVTTCKAYCEMRGGLYDPYLHTVADGEAKCFPDGAQSNSENRRIIYEATKPVCFRINTNSGTTSGWHYFYNKNAPST